ncbi:hypothetical protein C8J57DRAFT_1084887, partial [Mycena rebaudengoi]
SASYFASLIFQAAAELQYPQIYEPKTVFAWTFTDEIPSQTSHRGLEEQTIPHIDDLTPILQDMEAAFRRGARSVAVTPAVPGTDLYYLYSFSEVPSSHCCLLMDYPDSHSEKYQQQQACRHAVEGARYLVEYFSESSLLTQPLLDRINGCLILSKIFGFHVADFPLWKSSCLLGEGWLHEDVLNALLYFSSVVNSDLE